MGVMFGMIPELMAAWSLLWRGGVSEYIVAGKPAHYPKIVVPRRRTPRLLSRGSLCITLFSFMLLGRLACSGALRQGRFALCPTTNKKHSGWQACEFNYFFNTVKERSY